MNRTILEDRRCYRATGSVGSVDISAAIRVGDRRTGHFLTSRRGICFASPSCEAANVEHARFSGRVP